MLKFKINKNIISNNSKTYFIADIGANHDGKLSRARKLIRLCAKAGANAAKFQHFKAETIVLGAGFNKIGKLDHQSKWKDSVYNVYKKASINYSWTKDLVKECKKYKIDFLTSPYDLDYVDQLDRYLPAYKIGSGDITWKKILIKIAQKKKPVILASGASTLYETVKATKLLLKINKKVVLMQCNTNYTNSLDNFNHINLLALQQFKKIFKENIILGLSDHTSGHSTVLGAIALGAKVIEKHFTDDNNRIGPDHKFSMNFKTWSKMISDSRDLEKALGDGKKKIEKNEIKSAIIQRRGVWAKVNLKKNHILKLEDLKFLRPCPKNSISPFEINMYIGKKLKKKISKDNIISESCLNLQS